MFSPEATTRSSWPGNRTAATAAVGGRSTPLASQRITPGVIASVRMDSICSTSSASVGPDGSVVVAGSDGGVTDESVAGAVPTVGLLVVTGGDVSGRRPTSPATRSCRVGSVIAT
jgi:hypothetical protein